VEDSSQEVEAVVEKSGDIFVGKQDTCLGIFLRTSQQIQEDSKLEKLRKRQ
jgi:hypothetical protein